MDALGPLTLAIPLVAATALLAVGPTVGRRVLDIGGIGAAAATAALCTVLAVGPRLHVSWFGGWRPVEGRAIGIDLAIDPIGAGTAALAAVLALAALVYSWRYFEAVGALYHTLVLLFLGGMVGFAFTGDLFNLFVFFELLTTSAYALTAYRIEDPGPLQGSFNFAVTNTIGAFLILHGVGLLYARTGTLNMAEIGRELGTGEAGTVTVVAFALISAGLFVKAAIVPFHFWLPDAHSVAPSPVSVLLSGVMIQLGLYGWARIYWTAFAAVPDLPTLALRPVLIGVGTATAVVGGVMALFQLHLKRLLAFSSVSHSGLILIGVGLLDAGGLAGAGLYTLGHGAVKGALFLLAGILLHRYESVDEGELHGRGRGDRATAVVFVLAGLALAGLPPFGTTLGKQFIEEAAKVHGLGWVVLVFVAAGALTGGAVLRAAGRIFAGWGPAAAETGDEAEHDEERETSGPRWRLPAVLIAPPVVLVLLALALGLTEPIARGARAAAELFVDTHGYAGAVLDGVTATVPTVSGGSGLTLTAALLGMASAAAAVAVAALALWRDRVPAGARALIARVASPPLAVLRRLQSGHVGDYVAWLTFGAAALSGSYLLLLR